MAADQHKGHLAAVYRATRPDEVAALYDGWAATYEGEMASAGYRHPSIGVALLARYLPRGLGPVLDAGCGTGLVGQWLGILGYPGVEGLDISEGMLAVARGKACYSALHCLALGGALPFADGAFAGVISVGVFTTGHVGVEGLDELVRICRVGGVIVLTVKMAIWDAGFAARVAELASVEIVEQTEPYVSMPGEDGTSPSLAVVLRRV